MNTSSPRPGLRPPARLVDIARAAGVSTKTVSRVLNDEMYVTDATRQRVMDAVTELAYVGDAAATGLRTRKSGFIGLILPDVRNGFFALLTRAIEERLSPSSPTLLFGDSDEEAAQEERYLRTFRQQRVDGLIILPSGAPSLPDAVSEIPTVIVDRTVPSVRKIADHVLADNSRAAGRLVEHLVRHHGLRSVALVAGNTTVSNVRDRQAGYLRVVRAAGLEPHITSGHSTPDDAAAGALELFRDLTPPFGVFATNNRMFWGAMAAIARLGLHVPRDVLVTTIDSIGEATVTGLKPTQGVVPVQTVAAKAMRLLAERTEDPTLPPRRETVDIDIEFGTTCGCIPLTNPLMMGPVGPAPTAPVRDTRE
ncbi:LacI family DNA-binding transcriptional regulator [Microbacterium sp. 5K110]|jgi:DNA-binding LacI/PurR family transcriptional regulator|uniref:LacI family DNA-binding transcriptional regulator n=1 Tax=unclassified Microbacterium TaxID=2609290 RepID=UPI0010FD2935|nr:LacI family DNA-binding transcriptional regulator [Microbacterium sp. 5K110]TLF30313.1 LacI family transcriptional regulator [Microbacterium sp. 5K110]